MISIMIIVMMIIIISHVHHDDCHDDNGHCHAGDDLRADWRVGDSPSRFDRCSSHHQPGARSGGVVVMMTRMIVMMMIRMIMRMMMVMTVMMKTMVMTTELQY